VNNSYVVDKEKSALRNGSLLVSNPHYLVFKFPSLLNYPIRTWNVWFLQSCFKTYVEISNGIQFSEQSVDGQTDTWTFLLCFWTLYGMCVCL